MMYHMMQDSVEIQSSDYNISENKITILHVTNGITISNVQQQRTSDVEKIIFAKFVLLLNIGQRNIGIISRRLLFQKSNHNRNCQHLLHLQSRLHYQVSKNVPLTQLSTCSLNKVIRRL